MQQTSEPSSVLLSGLVFIGMIGIGISDTALSGQTQIMGIALCLAVMISSFVTMLVLNHTQAMDSKIPAAYLYRFMMIQAGYINARFKLVRTNSTINQEISF